MFNGIMLAIGLAVICNIALWGADPIANELLDGDTTVQVVLDRRRPNASGSSPGEDEGVLSKIYRKLVNFIRLITG